MVTAAPSRSRCGGAQPEPQVVRIRICKTGTLKEDKSFAGWALICSSDLSHHHRRSGRAGGGVGGGEHRQFDAGRGASGRVTVQGLVPSLTGPRETIKDQQVVSEGHSANHLPELAAPRGGGGAGGGGREGG